MKINPILTSRRSFMAGMFLYPLLITGQIFLPEPIMYKWPGTDQLHLRWEPASIEEWQDALKNGYHVEIYNLDNPNAILSEKNITPMTATEFGQLTKTIEADRRDFYSTCHALLYPQDQPGHDIIELMDAMEKTSSQTVDSFRISFLSFYSCLDAQLAEANALGTTITMPHQNDVRVVLRVDGHPAREIMASHAQDLSDFQFVPQITAIWGDRLVELQWDSKDRYKTHFGYYIETSFSGNHFIRTSSLPVLDPKVGMEGVKVGGGMLSFKDSLEVNYKTIYYRLRPVDYFGHVNEKMSQVSGYGFRVITTSPMLTMAEQMGNNTAHLTWSVQEKDMPLIRDFSVLRAPHMDGPYQVVMDSILKTQREVFIPMESIENYFRIETNPIDGKPLSSMPVFVIGIDSTPPAVPVVIGGQIDSNGMVRLEWHPCPEQDLWGYRVFKANFDNEEYALLNADPVLDTVFLDSIAEKFSTERIYYLIQALDKRNNRSPFTEPIIITKPDKTPPGFAVITKIQQQGDSVLLRWIPSASRDVVLHEVFRKNMLVDDEWILVKTIRPEEVKDSIIIDPDLVRNQEYGYTMRAKDDVGLLSLFAPAKQIKLSGPNTPYKPIRSIETTVDKEKKEITITWEVNNPEDYRSVLLYRGFDENRIGKYQYIDSPTMSFTEPLPAEGVVFYRLKPVFEGEHRAYMSEMIRHEVVTVEK